MLNIHTSAYLSPNTPNSFQPPECLVHKYSAVPQVHTVSLMTHTFLGLTSRDVQERS